MPLDPSIALNVRTPNIGDIALDYVQRRQKMEADAKQQKIVDLQTRQAESQLKESEQNAPTRALASLNEREQARFKSMTFAAANLKPLLESNNIDGAMQYLAQRKNSLEREGIDSNDTQELMQMIESDPKSAVAAVNQTLAFGEKLGFLKQAKADSGRGDYYTYFDTPDGIVAADARSPRLIDPRTQKPITDNRVVKSQNDPTLQSQISASKEVGKTVGEAVAGIGGKFDALDSVRDAQSILKKGIYSGHWGETQKMIAKATPGMDKTKAANTEQFVAYVGNTVIPRLKEFGGNDSNEEMRYLQGIMGGDIKMEEQALSKVLESSEKKIRAGIERVRKQAQSVGQETPDAPAPSAPKKRVRVDAQGNVIGD